MASQGHGHLPSRLCELDRDGRYLQRADVAFEPEVVAIDTVDEERVLDPVGVGDEFGIDGRRLLCLS